MRVLAIVAAGVCVCWLAGCGGNELSPEEQRSAFMEHVKETPQTDGTGETAVTDEAYGEAGQGQGTGGGGGQGGGRGRRRGQGGGEGGGSGFGRPHRRLPNRWRPMDSNKDGQLDRATEYAGVAEEFDRVDADGDGILMPTEMRPAKAMHAALAENFEHVDADGDGYISADEWTAAFNGFDANADGKVTPEELRAGANKELAAVVLGWFSHFDREPMGANGLAGDLVITREEWSTSFSEMDRIDPDGRLGRAEVLAGVGLRRALGTGMRSVPSFKTFPPRFQAMDADGDQKVSAAEFQGGKEEFARLDADGDGQLTIHEVRYSVPTVFALIYRMELIDGDRSESIDTEEWKNVFTALAPESGKGFDREALRAIVAKEGEEASRVQLARMVLAHFSHFDRNHDGTVTEQEWQLEFAVLDSAEPDGKLTPEELRAAVRRHAVLEEQKRRGD